MGGIKTNQAFKGSEIWRNDFQMTLKMHFKILLLVLFLQVTIFFIFLKSTMRENAFRIAGGSKGCVLVIGIQDFAQISKIYGPEKAESLFNSAVPR